MALIEVRDLALTFTRTTADGSSHTLEVLRELSFEVAEGEFCVIVGPSGAGKTTLLRIVQGMLRASGGSVSIDGVPVAGSQRECGFVFQNFGLLPWRTVLGNVEFGLQVRSMPPAERRAIALRYIEMVG